MTKVRASSYRKLGVVSSFEEACLALSVIPEIKPRSNSSGFHYLRAEGKKPTSARVTFFNAEKTAGLVINLVEGTSCLFFPKQDRKLSRAEKEAERIRAEQWRRITEEQKALWRAATAEKATRLLKASRPAEGNQYLAKKQVMPVRTLRQISAREFYSLGLFGSWHPYPDDENLLLVPVFMDCKVVNVQLIPVHGIKLSLPNGRLGGGCLWLSERLPPTSMDCFNIGLGEGVATILSVAESFEAQGVHMVAACSFGCSNLKSAAIKLKESYPKATVVIFGDLGNGSEAARDASEALCGDRNKLVQFPKFSDEEMEWYRVENNGKEPTDFNDKKVILNSMRCRKNE